MTDWRDLGDMTADQFVAELAGSPLAAEARAIHAAVRPHSILYRAILYHESKDGTLGVATMGTHNPTGMRPRSDTTYWPSNIYTNENGEYLIYPSWEEAAAEWKSRVTDPDYAYADAATVAEFVHTYAPSSDGNNEAEYVGVIESYAARFAEGQPVAGIVFGNVDHPRYQERGITKPENAGQNDLGQRRVKGVVWHRILGSLWGTDGYFRQAGVNALTDYGVGVAATDGAERAGHILRWNDPLGRQSGWASGSYSSYAYGDGAAFVNKYGIDAINRDQASVEVSGDQLTPLDEAARDAIAGITAYWADQYEIPWDQFPIAPQDGFSFVRWHEEFGPDNGQKRCPFDVVKHETPALIERTRAILKAAQGGTALPPPKVYADAELPDWFAETLEQRHPTDQRHGELRLWACRRNFVAHHVTRRLSKPDGATGENSGPKVQLREKISAEYVTNTGWILTTDGHWVAKSRFSPSVTFRS